MTAYSWLLKRFAYLALLATVPTVAAIALAHGWDRVAALLNGNWPPWVSNVANVVQIGSPAIALIAVWLAKVAQPRGTQPRASVAVRLLRLLALLLPAGDRERFVNEVLANLADRQRWWQRLDELLSVAAAVPGLAVILRWARRRKA
jgi:hypothetical protein